MELCIFRKSELLGYFSCTADITNVFVYAVTFFSTPLSSIIITHFLLNLRQAANEPHDDSPGTSHPSHSQSQCPTIRFGSFVDNMGEGLAHGTDTSHTDPDMAWPEYSNGVESTKTELGPGQSDLERNGTIDCPRADSSGLAREGYYMSTAVTGEEVVLMAR